MVPRGLKKGDEVWVRVTGGSLIRPARRAMICCLGASVRGLAPTRYYDIAYEYDGERRLWVGSDDYEVTLQSAVDRLGGLVR